MISYHSIVRALGTDNGQAVVNTPGQNITIPLVVSATNTYSSGIIGTIGTMTKVGVQVAAVAGGSAAGTLTLSASIDPAALNPTLSAQAIFTPIATVTLTAGAVSAVTTAICTASATTGASVLLTFDNAFRAIRVDYTNASGTSSLLCFISGVSG